MLNLPATSYVAVVTQRLRSASPLWLNTDRFNAELARAHAYCIPQCYEDAEIYQAEQRIQWADLYGGAGLGQAGGSGRCASVGRVPSRPFLDRGPRKPFTPAAFRG